MRIDTDGASNSGAFTFNTWNAGTVSEKMRITAAGSLGIGTTGPSQKLHVVGGNIVVDGRVGIGLTSPLTKLNIDTSTTYDGVVLSAGGTVLGQLLNFGSNTGGLQLLNGGTATVSLLAGGASYFTANAGVGIGTASPGTQLHVLGTNRESLRLSCTAGGRGGPAIGFLQTTMARESRSGTAPMPEYFGTQRRRSR
jgi:hypothetical protein